MASQLIICEKPSAAEKIAVSLADNKVKANSINGVPYYEIKINNKDTIVACTVGHLFSVTEKNKSGLAYPVFDTEWKESFKIRKKSGFAEKYYNVLKKLGEDIDTFIIATDKDLEGEVIGWNIMRFLYNKKDALRMEFSTLTKEDLIESYKNAKKHIDFPLAYSGETRHIMDWIWGINTSRALTLAIKRAGQFKIMSSGRVQGPTLNLIVKKEKEILAFKPIPFWNVNLITDKFIAQHEKGNIFEKIDAENILKNTKGKKAVVKQIKKTEFIQSPPYPFDLTSLQLEAYKTLGISPKETLSLAQDLYTNGLISYPRTSSQKLPPALNYKKIIEKLISNTNYKEICSELLNKKQLVPNEGKKCLSGDTLIATSNGEILTIKELVNNKHKTSIPCINQNCKITSAEIKDRHNNGKRNRILTIELKTNDEIQATENHPFLVLLNGSPQWIEARKLEKGLLIATPKKIDIKRKTKPDTILSIFNLFDAKEKNKILLYFKAKNNNFLKIRRPLIKEISACLNINFNTVKSYFQRKTIPYSIIEYLLKKNIIKESVIKKYVFGYVWSAGGNKIINLPFAINKNFSYFLGLIASDGHNTGREIQITNTIKIFNKLVKNLFSLEPKPYTLNFCVASKLLCEICHKLCIFKGKKARKLDIPNFILIQPDKIVLSYLAGYFDGDGSIYKNNNTIDLSIGSVSKNFLKKMKIILLTYGIHSRFHTGNLRIYSEYIDKFSRLIKKYTTIKKEKLSKLSKKVNQKRSIENIYLPSAIFKEILHKNNFTVKDISEIIGRIRYTTKRKYNNCYKLNTPQFKRLANILKNEEFKRLANADIAWVEIKNIENKFFNSDVFDLTMPFHNFIANGIISHNSDPAHPSCHPTGEFPPTLEGKQFRLYDLIARRFLSTFGENAKKQTNHIDIDVNNELFSVSGTITLEKGWINYYGRFAKSKDVELPKYKEGDEIKYKEIKIEDKETQPPKRYTPASIIKELDKKILGTKSTRAAIVDALYKRNYVQGTSIQATTLGIRTIETLDKYCGEIIDEKLTRHFEKEMEQIRENKKNPEEVLEEAKKRLVVVFKKFSENEEKIGKSLLESHRTTEAEMNTFGKCPKCNIGDLKILYSPRTKSKFVGCTHYPNCKNIYSLPRMGLIKKLEEKCKECGFYQVLVIRAGKRPWKLCLTPNCKSKEAWAKPFSEKALPKTDEPGKETKKGEIKEEKPKKVVKKRTVKKKKHEAS